MRYVRINKELGRASKYDLNRQVLCRLTTNRRHLEMLDREGFSTEAALFNEYRSYSIPDGVRIGKEMGRIFPSSEIATLSGWYIEKNGSLRPPPVEGLLIPIRDFGGDISTFRVLFAFAMSGIPIYKKWDQSSDSANPNFFHCPLVGHAVSDELVICFDPLVADTFTFIEKRYAIAVSSHNWQKAIDLAVFLKVKRVTILLPDSKSIPRYSEKIVDFRYGISHFGIQHGFGLWKPVRRF